MKYKAFNSFEVEILKQLVDIAIEKLTKDEKDLEKSLYVIRQKLDNQDVKNEKFYAVIKGNIDKPTIFYNWKGCKKVVDGFKGAIYKSFKSHLEAQRYIDQNS